MGAHFACRWRGGVLRLEKPQNGKDFYMSEPIQVPKIDNCARCGGVHYDLVFQPFTRPFCNVVNGEISGFTHWCPCPNNQEPILMLVVTAEEGTQPNAISQSQEARH